MLIPLLCLAAAASSAPQSALETDLAALTSELENWQPGLFREPKIPKDVLGPGAGLMDTSNLQWLLMPKSASLKGSGGYVPPPDDPDKLSKNLDENYLEFGGWNEDDAGKNQGGFLAAIGAEKPKKSWLERKLHKWWKGLNDERKKYIIWEKELPELTQNRTCVDMIGDWGSFDVDFAAEPDERIRVQRVKYKRQLHTTIKETCGCEGATMMMRMKKADKSSDDYKQAFKDVTRICNFAPSGETLYDKTLP